MHNDNGTFTAGSRSRDQSPASARYPTPTRSKREDGSIITPTTNKYKHVESKLSQPTVAAINAQYEWKVPAEETELTERELKWNKSSEISKKPLGGKALLYSSHADVHLIGGVSADQLPTPPSNSMYKNIKSKLMQPTAAQLLAKQQDINYTSEQLRNIWIGVHHHPNLYMVTLPLLRIKTENYHWKICYIVGKLMIPTVLITLIIRIMM